MHAAKRLLGLGLSALGVLGIVICLAGIGGVWIAGSRLQRVNSQVFRRADELVVQVDQRAAQAREAVGGTRELVDQLKQRLQESAPELPAERVASLPEIDDLQRRLAAAMERADGLVQLSASTAELIEQMLAIVGSIAAERNVDLKSASGLTPTMRSARESLANVSERLGDVQRRLTDLQRKRDVDVHLSEIGRLSLGIVAKLDVVQKQIAVFRTRLDETRSRLGELQGRIRWWILAGQWLIVLLIAWGGAGQVCLLLQGSRLVRTPRSPSA